MDTTIDPLVTAKNGTNTPVAGVSPGFDSSTTNAKVQFSGWLMKRGALWKSWKRRYLVLSGRILSYYENENFTKPPQGRIILDDECYLVPFNNDCSPGGIFAHCQINSDGTLASQDTENPFEGKFGGYRKFEKNSSPLPRELMETEFAIRTPGRIFYFRCGSIEEKEDWLWQIAQSVPPAFGGYLLKQGLKKKNWKQRWFLLIPSLSMIKYYKKMTDKDSLSQISLANCDVLDISGKIGRYFSFSVATPSRIFYFQAKDQVSCDKWMNLMKQASKNYQLISVPPIRESLFYLYPTPAVSPSPLPSTNPPNTTRGEDTEDESDGDEPSPLPENIHPSKVTKVTQSGWKTAFVELRKRYLFVYSSYSSDQPKIVIDMVRAQSVRPTNSPGSLWSQYMPIPRPHSIEISLSTNIEKNSSDSTEQISTEIQSFFISPDSFEQHSKWITTLRSSMQQSKQFILGDIVLSPSTSMMVVHKPLTESDSTSLLKDESLEPILDTTGVEDDDKNTIPSMSVEIQTDAENPTSITTGNIESDPEFQGGNTGSDPEFQGDNSSYQAQPQLTQPRPMRKMTLLDIALGPSGDVDRPNPLFDSMNSSQPQIRDLPDINSFDSQHPVENQPNDVDLSKVRLSMVPGHADPVSFSFIDTKARNGPKSSNSTTE